MRKDSEWPYVYWIGNVRILFAFFYIKRLGGWRRVFTPRLHIFTLPGFPSTEYRIIKTVVVRFLGIEISKETDTGRIDIRARAAAERWEEYARKWIEEKKGLTDSGLTAGNKPS
jgi:hypothetical protein